MKNKINNLHNIAQFALFVSSYLPLFCLIVVRQASDNVEYFHWAGFTGNGIKTFFLKFGLSTILTTISILRCFGYQQTLGNIGEVAKNGSPVTIKDVKNKNSEAIGYIATYIIPFLLKRNTNNNIKLLPFRVFN